MTGERYFKNLADTDHNGLAYGSNFITPNVEGVNYPIIHDLGTELIDDNDLTINADSYNAFGNTVLTYDNPSGTLHVVGDGTEDAGIIITENLPSDTPGMRMFKFNFSEVLIDTQMKLTNNADSVVFTPVEGINTVYVDSGGYRTWTLRSEFSEEVDLTLIDIGASTKEISLPTESYLNYFDEFGKVQQLSSTGDAGNELNTNSEFELNTNGWNGNNVDSTLIWNAGQADFANQEDWAYQRKGINLVPGSYIAQISVTAISGELHIGFGTSGNNINSTGVYEDFVYRSTEGNQEIQIRPPSAGLKTATIDYYRVKEILSVSTMYNITQQHQMVWNSTSPLSDEDIIALEDNPNLIMDVWFNGDALPSGYSFVDMGNFFPGNEGFRSGPYVQDVSVYTLVTNTAKYDINNDIFNPSFGAGTKTFVDDTYGRAVKYSEIDSDAFRVGVFYYSDYAIVSDYVPITLKFKAKSLLGTAYFTTGETSAVITIPEDTDIPIGTEWVEIIFLLNSSSGTAGYSSIFGNTGDEIFISDFEVYYSSVEMSNYTEANRLTNQLIGMNNLLINQDASGRALNTTNPGDIAVDSEKYVATNWMPSMEKYAIRQKISGELQDFGSEIFTNPKFETDSVWQKEEATIIDEEATLTVVGGAMSSIYEPGLTLEQGKYYLITFDIKENTGSFTMVSGISTNVLNPITFDSVGITQGVYFAEEEVTNLGVKRLATSGDYYCIINSYSVKELTTKTQRTETRLLLNTPEKTIYQINGITQDNPELPDSGTLIDIRDIALIGYPDKINTVSAFAVID